MIKIPRLHLQKGAIESWMGGIAFGFWMHSFVAGLFMVCALSMLIEKTNESI